MEREKEMKGWIRGSGGEDEWRGDGGRGGEGIGEGGGEEVKQEDEVRGWRRGGGKTTIKFS